MDMLRTSYKVPMRTIIGGSPVPVQWYRTADDTPVYGATSSMRSRVWITPHDNDGIGEQVDTIDCCDKLDLDWVNGSTPASVTPGPSPCGSATVAFQGAGPSDPKFMTDSSGRAPCCFPPGTWTTVLTYTPFQDLVLPGSGDFPPSGTTCNWIDSDGNSGSFVSAGNFSVVTYGFHGAATYDIDFVITGTPHVDTIWPVSMSLNLTQAWGLRYCRRFVRFASDGAFVQTVYTWS